MKLRHSTKMQRCIVIYLVSMAFTRHTAKDATGYNKVFHELKWNSEGNYIGMISGDKSVKIGQLDKTGSFQNVHSIPNSAQLSQIAWNPADDSRIGLCGDDKYVELWDVRASKASAKLATAGNNISLAWSPCGTFVAVGNKTDLVSVVDLRTGTTLKKKRFAYEVNELAWTANPHYLVAATGGDGAGYLDVLSLQDSDLPPALTTTNTTATNTNTATTTANLSSAVSNSSATSVSATELAVLDRVCAHVNNCTGVKVDASFRRMAVGSMDGVVSFWDLEDMVCLHNTNVESEVRSMSFSGDGRFLAVAGEDPNVLICDTHDGAILAKVPARHRVNAVAWHPAQHHNLLAVAADDRSPAPQFLRFLAFPAC